jgi:hypothetical protein
LCCSLEWCTCSDREKHLGAKAPTSSEASARERKITTEAAGAESLTRSALEPWRQKQNSSLETETEPRRRMPALRGFKARLGTEPTAKHGRQQSRARGRSEPCTDLSREQRKTSKKRGADGGRRDKPRPAGTNPKICSDLFAPQTGYKSQNFHLNPTILQRIYGVHRPPSLI